jgi:hypothetical protein
VTSTEEIRAQALALPEVTEEQHARFRVPLWKVRGKTFLGMGRDERTAVFRIPEAAAAGHTAADPAAATPVRRTDARRSFLGLEVRLDGVAPELVRQLVREAWAAQAPRALVERHGGDA